MNRYLCFTALLTAGLLTGCAGSAEPHQLLNVTLNSSQANQGQAGMAVFIGKGEETALDFTIGGVPSGVSTPLQLQSFIYPGSCTRLGAQPTYSMNQNTQAFAGQAGWIMSKIVPAALSTLQAGNYAVVVRTSQADGNQEIFCGDIR